MSEGALNWRRAQASDAPQIARLEAAFFGETAWSESTVTEELTGVHRRYTVIEVDDDIVGYGGVLVVGADADIQTIAVSERLRGRGLGTQLLDRLVRDAQELGAYHVFLEVRSDNPVAIHLYERKGFTRIGIRRGYYRPDNVDAIVMRLDLRRVEKDGEE